MNANFGNHIVRMYGDYDKMRKLASLVIAIDPKSSAILFCKTMAKMVTELHAVKPARCRKVLAPNDPQMHYKEKMPTGRYSGSGRNIPLSGRELITTFSITIEKRCIYRFCYINQSRI